MDAFDLGGTAEVMAQVCFDPIIVPRVSDARGYHQIDVLKGNTGNLQTGLYRIKGKSAVAGFDPKVAFFFAQRDATPIDDQGSRRLVLA